MLNRFSTRIAIACLPLACLACEGGDTGTPEGDTRTVRDTADDTTSRDDVVDRPDTSAVDSRSADGEVADGSDREPDGGEASEIPTSPGLYGPEADLTMQSNGERRRFGLYLPESFDAEEPSPVYFVFHGGGPGDESTNFGKITGDKGWHFEEKADQNGGVVVYPFAIPKMRNGKLWSNWNDGREPTPDHADIGFVKKLLERLDRALTLDRDRVFATGASNGGMFSYRVGCELTETFTAVAPVIAALPEKLDCSPAQQVSILAIQGTFDPFIDYEGGNADHDCTRKDIPTLGGKIKSADATRAFWASQNSCESEPTLEKLSPKTDDPNTTVYRYRYDECEASARLEFYAVEGMGHQWPPDGVSKPLEGRKQRLKFRLAGVTSKQINATDQIWRFFNGDPPSRSGETVANPQIEKACRDK